MIYFLLIRFDLEQQLETNMRKILQLMIKTDAAESEVWVKLQRPPTSSYKVTTLNLLKDIIQLLSQDVWQVNELYM